MDDAVWQGLGISDHRDSTFGVDGLHPYPDPGLQATLGFMIVRLRRKKGTAKANLQGVEVFSTHRDYNDPVP